MDYFVEHFEQIIEAYEAVLAAVQRLCLHIHDHDDLDLVDFPVWVDNGEGQFIADRGRLVYVLQHFSMDKTLTPTETFSCPGVVASTLQTFTLIDTVNAKKMNLK